jgi:Ca2+-binding EF-hand superfamily protein
MRAWLFLSVILAAFLACLPSPALSLRSGDDVQDLVYFHASRPYRLRLHVRVDNRSFAAAWTTSLQKLFAFLDADGDGFLSKMELAHAPSPKQLRQMARSTTQIEPGPAPEFWQVDSDGDGRVTFAELADYYQRHNLGPIQLEFGRRLGRTDLLNDTLVRLLDADNDGKLSRDELRAAGATLRRLDTNDDELLTIQELLSGIIPAGFQFWHPGDEEPPEETAPPFLLLRASDLRDALPRQLLAHYDKDKDGKLSRAEIGLSAAAFYELDTIHDGFLDAAELIRWQTLPPDYEIAVHLGKTPARDAVASLHGGGRKTLDNSVLLALPSTQLEVVRCELPFLQTKDGLAPYRGLFRALDTNRDGYVDSREVFKPPFEFVALLRLADRDGDGRISEKEFDAFLELRSALPASPVVLTIADRGKSLFDFLDANRDGKLGMRELNTAWDRLALWDRDADGRITRTGVPDQYQITLSYGQQRNTEPAPFPGYGPASRPTRPVRGPLWFRKMDRNNDGDVSPREFLGTMEQFRKLDLDGDGLISVEEAERAEAGLRKK